MEFLSCSPSQKWFGQAREKNEEISTQKQDKNVGISRSNLAAEVPCHNPAKIWLDFRPDCWPDSWQWRNQIFFQNPCQSGQELAGFPAGFSKNISNQKFFFLRLSGLHKLPSLKECRPRHSNLY